jgi:hypothetical protein
VGVAAAAAIASSKKKRRNLAFETNPSIRKRQATRLTRKLKVIGGGGGVVGKGHGPNIYKDTKPLNVVFTGDKNRVYRLKIQSVLLVFSTALVN